MNTSGDYAGNGGQLVFQCCLTTERYSSTSRSVHLLAEIKNGKSFIQAPVAAEVQSVWDTLDALTNSVFEKIPQIKSNLQPLLDAGK